LPGIAPKLGLGCDVLAAPVDIGTSPATFEGQVRKELAHLTAGGGKK